MDKGAINRFAVSARNKLMEAVSQKVLQIFRNLLFSSFMLTMIFHSIPRKGER